MRIKTRNLLCIKDKENLDLGHRLIYEPYKNIIEGFFNLSTDVKAKEFDPIIRIFDGLESIPQNIKHYYESLLGITSYYQHSQGGKGKYIEKKFASVFENCSLNIKISEFPLLLEYPQIHRKKGIFRLNGLNRKEKEIMREIEWDYLIREDETTDLGSLLKKENTIVLVEIKNRVDSGGTAGRREIWLGKFEKLFNFLNSDEALYRKDDRYFSLRDFLKEFGFCKIEIYIGIIYNRDGSPATVEKDREQGFYSSNLEGYSELKRIISNKGISIVNDSLDNLEFEILLGDVKVKFGAIYGNEIPYKLFRKRYSISDLLILRYDDIWLSQLIAITEKMFLLKFGNNYIRIFQEIRMCDEKIRKLYNKFVISEGSENKLYDLLKYLLNNYSKRFEKRLCPSDRNSIEYLADIIQFIGSAEA